MTERVYSKWVCPRCGDEVTQATPDPWDCVVCGEQMEPERECAYVPVKELQELVATWRNRSWSGWSHPRDGAYKAASELEGVIEENE